MFVPHPHKLSFETSQSEPAVETGRLGGTCRSMYQYKPENAKVNTIVLEFI